ADAMLDAGAFSWAAPASDSTRSASDNRARMFFQPPRTLRGGFRSGAEMAVNVAIAGATGAVGAEFLRSLAERDYPIKSLKLLASKRSAGRKLTFKGEELP